MTLFNASRQSPSIAEPTISDMIERASRIDMAVWPVGGKGIENVRCCDDPRFARQLFAGQAVRIPLAVQWLVVTPDDAGEIAKGAMRESIVSV